MPSPDDRSWKFSVHFSARNVLQGSLIAPLNQKLTQILVIESIKTEDYLCRDL